MPARVPPLNTDFVPNLAAADQNALRTQIMRNNLAAMPEEQNWLRKQRDWAQQDRNYMMQQRPIEQQRAAFGYLQQIAPSLNIQSYLGMRPQLIEQGLPEAMLPDASMIEQAAATKYGSPEAAFEDLRNTWAQIGQQAPAVKWSAPKEGVDESGKPVVYRVSDQGEIDILKGVSPTPKRGMKIYDPNTGNLMLDTSGGAEPEMTKKTQGNIEQKILDGSNQIARMEAIYSGYKPEYQEVGTRFKAAWTGTKAFLGMGIEEPDRQLLSEFKTFQRKSIENINLYIKELTGAQMSEREADRLRLAQPDPGEKWYQGDDPITFKAKMDDVLKTARASVARYKYYLSQGLTPKQIKNMINDGKAVSLQSIASRM